MISLVLGKWNDPGDSWNIGISPGWQVRSWDDGNWGVISFKGSFEPTSVDEHLEAVKVLLKYWDQVEEEEREN